MKKRTKKIIAVSISVLALLAFLIFLVMPIVTHWSGNISERKYKPEELKSNYATSFETMCGTGESLNYVIYDLKTLRFTKYSCCNTTGCNLRNVNFG